MTLTLFCALAAAAHGEGPAFSDGEPGSWSREAIEYAVGRGLMYGVGGGAFDPGGEVTRAMAVTVLYRLKGEPSAPAESPFSDVGPGEYYSAAVSWAESAGVVRGKSESAFDPDCPVTREQLVTMLRRLCDGENLYVDGAGDLDGFADRDTVSDYAEESVSWAVGADLLYGTPDGMLDPGGPTTREQFAAVIERFDQAEFLTLADFYRPYVEQMADHAEYMLRSAMEKFAADPDYTLPDLHVWGKGLLAMGLFDLGRYDVVEEYIDMWWDHPGRGGVLSADAGLAGYCVLGLYEMTGEEKYEILARECLEGILARPTDRYGEIKYDRNDNEDILVDGTGMVTPFLARYAAVFGDEEVRRIAVLQVTNYLRMGVIPRYYYAYHGYSAGGTLQGEMGWGRGTGYLMLAIGSVMHFCGDGDANAKCETFIEHTMTRLKPDFKFGWTLSDPDAPSDTSATGKIMWGVLMAKEAGLAASVSDATVKAIAKAGLSDVYDGVVRGASGGSGGFGSYSESYDENTEYGQGAMLCFYAAFMRYLESGR